MIVSGTTVTAFYEVVHGIHPDVDYSQQQLIDVCRESWERNGFSFRLLSSKDIQPGPLASKYKGMAMSLPTVNPSRYERACFMRWLAMAHNGGGLMIDYDVVNVNCREIDVADNGMTLLQGGCPSVVYGSPDDYIRAVCRFIELAGLGSGRTIVCDRQHVSDQTMVDQCFGEKDATKLGTVIPFSDAIAPGRHLVHCSTDSTTGRGHNRLAAMTSLLSIGVE